MPAKPLTLADLRKVGTITSYEIVAAIDAFIRDPASGPYRFASGHSLDIAAAVEASVNLAELMARPGPKEKAFRTAVTTIVMMALPRRACRKLGIGPHRPVRRQARRGSAPASRGTRCRSGCRAPGPDARRRAANLIRLTQSVSARVISRPSHRLCAQSH